MSTHVQPTLALPPNPTSSLFSALSSSTSLAHLKQVHAQILRRYKLEYPSNDFLLQLVVSACALSPGLYSATSPSLDYALSVFNQISRRDDRISSKLLRELSRGGKPVTSLLVYGRLRKEGLVVDRFIVPLLLKAVSRASALEEGLEIHGLASKLGFGSDPFVQTGLVGMYASCGRIMEARLVFDKMSHRDVVTWSIMIDGYCQSGLFDDALQLFEEMKASNVEPDEMILSKIVSACGRGGSLSYGKTIHKFITENNIVLDTHLQSALVTMYASFGSMDLAQELFNKMSPKNLIVSTAMVSAYARLGRVEDARMIFDQMVEKDLVCWSAMISCYAESDQPQEALNLFNEMQVFGIKPDQVSMLGVISACAHLGALDHAKWIHVYIDRSGFGGALRVGNALIDMYAKCGSLERARLVFENMPKKDVISWTSIIRAFAMHGDAQNAIRLFHQMRDEKIEPNGVTFVGVLYACSHGGLVEEGRKIFLSMINEHNISPKQEHFGCMVDLFGRANLLREALEVIETMPFPPSVVIWGSLMSACWIHGEIELGEFAAKQVLKLEPDHDGALVVLSNIYAKEKRWEDVGEVRNLMKHKSISKEKGCSRIELNNEVFQFFMADRNHKEADQIYEKLDEVVSKLKLVGYTPNTCGVLVDVEEDKKKKMVLWHSEKLALCYGLMNDSKESRIRIVKNLRICEDCHTFMKLVSKVYGREIVVRDRTRFHHYKNGLCSCEDYW